MRKHQQQLERYSYHPIQMLLVKYNLTFAMYSLCFCCRCMNPSKPGESAEPSCPEWFSWTLNPRWPKSWPTELDITPQWARAARFAAQNSSKCLLTAKACKSLKMARYKIPARESFWHRPNRKSTWHLRLLTCWPNCLATAAGFRFCFEVGTSSRCEAAVALRPALPFLLRA